MHWAGIWAAMRIVLHIQSWLIDCTALQHSVLAVGEPGTRNGAQTFRPVSDAVHDCWGWHSITRLCSTITSKINNNKETNDDDDDDDDDFTDAMIVIWIYIWVVCITYESLLKENGSVYIEVFIRWEYPLCEWPN